MRLNSNSRVEEYDQDYYRTPKHKKYEPVKKKNERFEDYLFDDLDLNDFEDMYEKE